MFRLESGNASQRIVLFEDDCKYILPLGLMNPDITTVNKCSEILNALEKEFKVTVTSSTGVNLEYDISAKSKDDALAEIVKNIRTKFERQDMMRNMAKSFSEMAAQFGSIMDEFNKVHVPKSEEPTGDKGKEEAPEEPPNPRVEEQKAAIERTNKSKDVIMDFLKQLVVKTGDALTGFIFANVIEKIEDTKSGLHQFHMVALELRVEDAKGWRNYKVHFNATNVYVIQPKE